MNILVCVKQVPDPEAPMEIDEAASWFRPKDSRAYRMNRFDEYALEEALRLKERLPGTRVDAISLGPQRAERVLRRAMGMGVDGCLHLLDPEGGYRSPLTVAAALAHQARGPGYDLIFAGVMAEDDMQGLVGPMLAEMLNMPCATSAIFQRPGPAMDTVYVEREIEGGYRHCLELPLPAVLTVQAGINRPRYPSLSNMLSAGRGRVATVRDPLADSPPPLERVSGIRHPPKSRTCTMLEGSQRRKAERLLEILRQRSFA